MGILKLIEQCKPLMETIEMFVLFTVFIGPVIMLSLAAWSQCHGD